MQWLIILFLVGGEPAIKDGWQPIQVDADRCEEVKARTSKYLANTHGEQFSVTCADAMDADAIAAAIAAMGDAL